MIVSVKFAVTMKMKNSVIGLLAVSGLLFAAACKKKGSDDGNIDISGKTNQQVFMMQPWKVGSWIDSTSTGKDDALDPMMKDDKFTFNSTTQYIHDRFSTRASGEAATENEPWSMTSANASTVTLMGATYTILGKTSTAITLSRTYMIGPDEHKETLTFGKY